MRHLALILFGILFSGSILAQEQGSYIVELNDKKSDYYSTSNPQAFLTDKALARRTKYGITINEKDLPVSPEYVYAIQRAGYKVTNRVKWLNTLIVKGVGRQPLADFDFVHKVTATLAYKSDSANEKPFFSGEKLVDGPVDYKESETQNRYDYGSSFNQISMLNGHLLHNEGYNGKGITIAVLDAGFQKVDEIAAFDSLWINDQIIDTKNFVNSENVFSPDINSHGMHVLSTMGGYLPGELVGTAPKADYYLVRTEDATDEYLLEEYYWVDGAEYADSVGADIINSSLGYTNGFKEPRNNHTYEDMNGDSTPVTIGADIAAQKGILVVNSAGNSGNDEWEYIGAPADGDSVLAVGAVGANGNYVSFSSKGPTYDGRVKPNVAAKGASVTVAAKWGGVTYINGTSFSSPLTAGMAASLWQALPEKTNMELIDLIQENGHQFENPDTLLGYGLPDYAAALNLTGIAPHNRRELVQKIGPNPFDDYIDVKTASNHEYINYSLVALSGRVIKKGTLYPWGRSVRIRELGNLQQGMYILRLRLDGHSVSRKLVKN